MTEIEIPPDADEREARDLVEEFVEIGDVVEVRTESVTGTDRTDVTGEVTASRTRESGPDYLELDGQALGAGSIGYDDIETVVRKRESTADSN